MLFQQFRQPRLLLVLVIFLISVAILWGVRNALFPFILGLGVAYLISPPSNWLQGCAPTSLKEQHLARPLASF